MLYYPIVPVPKQAKGWLRRCYARSSRRLPVQIRVWVCRRRFLKMW